MPKRDDSITIAKGIGMILMVVCHAGIPIGQEYIYMFHMPLFFIASGYCFNEKYLNNFKTFVTHRIKGLYVPYIKYGLIFLLLHNLFFHLNIYNCYYGYGDTVYHPYSLPEFFHKLVGALLFRNNEMLIGGYWFLPQLFFGAMIGWILLKIVRNPWIGVLITIIFSLVFLQWSLYIPHTSFCRVSILSASFFLIGYCIKKYSIQSKGFYGILCAIIVLLGSIYFCSDMWNWSWSSIFPFILCATLGSLMVIQLSKIISSYKNSYIHKFIKKPLVTVGNHSLDILTWHFLSFKIISLLIIFVEARQIIDLAQFPILLNQQHSFWWIFYTIIGIVLPISYVICKKIISQRLLSKYSTSYGQTEAK